MTFWDFAIWICLGLFFPHSVGPSLVLMPFVLLWVCTGRLVGRAETAIKSELGGFIKALRLK